MAETDDADAAESGKRPFTFQITRKRAGGAIAAHAVQPAPSVPDDSGEADVAEDESTASTVDRAVAGSDSGTIVRAPLPPAAEPSRPLSDETLASMVAGRRLETEEDERTFLLTLSRDQRLKYAELLNASERLDLDRETHNLEFDRLQFQRERLVADRIDRFRSNAFTFAVSGIRTLLAMNGAGALVVLAIWGYLAALPAPPISADAFVLALAAFGLGAVGSACTALVAYGAQAVRAGSGRHRLRRGAGEILRVGALALVLLAFASFLAGILLAGHGLKAG